MDHDIYSFLYTLGLSENYTGFGYIVDAVRVALQEPESLQMVTKWLYPEVAKHYKKNWKSVERNIRTAISVMWDSASWKMEAMTGCPWGVKPTNAQFIAALTHRVASV